DAAEHLDARGRHRADHRSLAWRKQIDAVERRSHPEAVQKCDVGLALHEYVIEEHYAAHVGDGNRPADDRGSRAGERLEKVLAARRHLADSSGSPPYVGLKVDQNRRFQSRGVTIGDALK